MWIDVYDFDGTLFRGDSTFAFWAYCLRKKPSLLRRVPRQVWGLFGVAAGRWDLTRGKSEFLCYFQDIDVADMAKRFWAEPATQKRLAGWFQPRQDELPAVIASASPEATLTPVAAELGAQYLIGTRADPRTGALLGLNCKGQEKVARLRALLPDCRIRAMYTDDVKADAPLLALAQQKYLVRRGKVTRLW
jgi:phosphoserine phosphatase